LFLERPRIAIAVATDQFSVEIARAGRVLALWRGHRELTGIIDMTTPGQAIVRLEPGAAEGARHRLIAATDAHVPRPAVSLR
jgi:hypothetical protein